MILVHKGRQNLIAGMDYDNLRFAANTKMAISHYYLHLKGLCPNNGMNCVTCSGVLLKPFVLGTHTNQFKPKEIATDRPFVPMTLPDKSQ